MVPASTLALNLTQDRFLGILDYFWRNLSWQTMILVLMWAATKLLVAVELHPRLTGPATCCACEGAKESCGCCDPMLTCCILFYFPCCPLLVSHFSY